MHGGVHTNVTWKTMWSKALIYLSYYHYMFCTSLIFNSFDYIASNNYDKQETNGNECEKEWLWHLCGTTLAIPWGNEKDHGTPHSQQAVSRLKSEPVSAELYCKFQWNRSNNGTLPHNLTADTRQNVTVPT